MRPRPSAPIPPPTLMDGSIAYALWLRRLLRTGIRGAVKWKVREALAGLADSGAELLVAERYAAAGYAVEVVLPPALGEPDYGERSPDLRVRYGDTPVARVEIKRRAVQAGISRNALDHQVNRAYAQLTSTLEGHGDIILDAAEALAPGTPLDEDLVVRFLKGKVTGNRFRENARLSHSDYLEIVCRSTTGQLLRYCMVRDDAGDAQGPRMEVFTR